MNFMTLNMQWRSKRIPQDITIEDTDLSVEANINISVPYTADNLIGKPDQRAIPSNLVKPQDQDPIIPQVTVPPSSAA